MKKVHHKAKLAYHFSLLIIIVKTLFWFLCGTFLGLFFTGSFIFFLFHRLYGNTIFPGITIMAIPVGGRSPGDVLSYFAERNMRIGNTTFTFTKDDQIATVSAKEVHLGFDGKRMVDAAFALGRSKNAYNNIATVIQTFFHGFNVPASFTYSPSVLLTKLNPIIAKEKIAPRNAQFSFANGKVTAFILSSDGQEVVTADILRAVSEKIPYVTSLSAPLQFSMVIPVRVIKPAISSENVDNLGIKEMIGTGSSYFHHSIDSRVFNIGLAASRVNGILVPPGQVFSFDSALGDVSNLTGYKQAYIIENGHTILGDGGGVCQVSTTLFRAILNAGLPIVERHGHAYRVGYYEEDDGPGIDATIFVPTVDLKFKNDTSHYILIQSIMDPQNFHLVYNLYGSADGRSVTMTKPVITNQTPPPPDKFQDDPTIPSGVIKQVDFAAWGAHVSFSRTVTKNNALYFTDTYETDYQPWQAVYLRGTGR